MSYFTMDMPNQTMSPQDILDLDISLNEINKEIPKYRDDLEKNLVDKYWMKGLMGQESISDTERQKAIDMLVRDKTVHEGYATGKYPVSELTGDIAHHKKWMNAYDILIRHFQNK